MPKVVRTFLLSAAALATSNAFSPCPALHHQLVIRESEPLRMVATSSADNLDEFPDKMPQMRPSNEDETSASSSALSAQKEQTTPSSSDSSTSRFAQGDELHRLRHQVLGMRLELQQARLNNFHDQAKSLERTIMKAQQADAEFVYVVSLERMELAQQQGKFQEAEAHGLQAQEARATLPQFSLDGLWVGKYGDHGYEMVNVTYRGDVLIAHKVTGTKNVPRGESTFEVDLSPRQATEDKEMLEPIELGDSASQQWGCKYLQRFGGRGQIAAEGYLDSQWIEGQLILVNEYFSFAWLPIGHQVFFGRPTAELILQLMKEEKKSESGNCENKAFLERCWEETELIEDDNEVSEDLFVSTNQQDYYEVDGCFE